MPRTFLLALVLTMLVGCKGQTSQPRPLDPYERWRSSGLHDYTIDQMRACFCPQSGQTMRIIVRADTIASVRKLSDGSAVSYPISTLYLTIDSLFGIIRYSGTDSLVVTYNEIYGYPERLDVNPQLHPVDGGVLYETSNLQIP